MSALVGRGHRRFESFVRKVDQIVAVCSWVADVLRVNGVPEAKLTVCRQGLSPPITSGLVARDTRRTGDVLRLGYFGRLDPTKGVDLLIEALRRVPDAKVRLDVHGLRQAGSENYTAQLENAAVWDPRVSIRPALPPDGVIAAMSFCDLVVVPSRCLETGPLVVLEFLRRRGSSFGRPARWDCGTRGRRGRWRAHQAGRFCCMEFCYCRARRESGAGVATPGWHPPAPNHGRRRAPDGGSLSRCTS